MICALITSIIVAGIFYILWEEEREKLAKAEKQIKELKRRNRPVKKKTDHVAIVNSKGSQGYLITKSQTYPVKPLLDQKKLEELQIQTKASQDMLAEIFIQEEDMPTAVITQSDNRRMVEILSRLFEKDVWMRSEIAEIVGPDVMIGNLLEQINDFSCSKIDDIVVEEDDDKIYVTTEYKTKLI